MTTDREAANGQPDSAEEVPYGEGVFLFLGLLVGGIVVFVALLYGFFWLTFDAGNLGHADRAETNGAVRSAGWYRSMP